MVPVVHFLAHNI